MAVQDKMATSRRYQGIHPPDCTCIYCVADRTAASQSGSSKIGRGAPAGQRRPPQDLLARVTSILSGEELQARVQRAREARLAQRRHFSVSRAIGVIANSLALLIAIALFIFVALPSDLRDTLVGLSG